MRKSAHELLTIWKSQQNLDLYKTSPDPDMALLSHRAVFKDRVDEAAEPYPLTVNDPATPAGIKEEALYQLSLMYLAPDNPHLNRDKAIEYLCRQLLDYPGGGLSSRVGRCLDQALNVQPR